jgi:plastocyanin
MKLLWTGACCWAAVLSAGAAPAELVDVHGTARVGTREAASAVIWLAAPDAPPSPPQARIVLDQRNLAFDPIVLAVRVGTAVEFPNNDRVFHNVFSFREGKVFDLGLYPVGTSKRVIFDRAGVSRLFCNIHPTMAAYVVAVDTPYFAVTDRAGAFTIGAVPPGDYRFHAWRPGGPELTGTWSSTSGAPLDVEWR